METLLGKQRLRNKGDVGNSKIYFWFWNFVSSKLAFLLDPVISSYFNTHYYLLFTIKKKFVHFQEAKLNVKSDWWKIQEQSWYHN